MVFDLGVYLTVVATVLLVLTSARPPVPSRRRRMRRPTCEAQEA